MKETSESELWQADPPDALNGRGPTDPGAVGTGAGPLGRIGLRWAIGLAAIGAAITAVGAAAALAVTALLPAQYAARTELLYRISSEQPTGFLREDRTLTTQALLLESRTVLEPVAAAHGLGVDELGELVDAEVLEGSLILEVEVRNGDRAVGLQLVRAISDRYFELVQAPDRPELRRYFETQLSEIRSRLRGLPATAPERPELAQREVDVQSQLDELELALSRESRAEVVVPPYSADSPISPRPTLAVATGGLAGLLVALAVVALLARRRIRGWR